MSEDIHTREQFITPDRKSQMFHSETRSQEEPYERLYADSKKIREKKRQTEVEISKKRNKECPFKPEKHSQLEFQYIDEFKDPGKRLYNNFFEIQEKISMAKEERDKELRSMSETRGSQNINVSITNNFINSSVNIKPRGRSVRNSKVIYLIL